MAENGTQFMPGIMVLPEGSEIEVNKGQLEILEETQEMVLIENLEFKIEKMMKKDKYHKKIVTMKDDKLLRTSSSGSDGGLPSIKRRNGSQYSI